MRIKEEKGLAGIDIAISVIVITIFIAMIGNLIVNINLNAKTTERKTIATSYAVKEIEQIKGKGYISDYNGKRYWRWRNIKRRRHYRKWKIYRIS